MKYIIIITMIFITSCASIEKPIPSIVLLGSWCELVPGDNKCGGYMRYHSDGKYSAYGSSPEYNERWESYGQWVLSGGMICIKPQKRLVFKLSTGKQLDTSTWPLENYCDEIVEYSSGLIIIDTPHFEEHSKLIKVSE